VALDAKQGKLRVDDLNAKMLSAAAIIAEAEGSELHIVHAFSQNEVNIMRGKRLCRDLTGFTDTLRNEIKSECDALLQATSISLNPNNIHLVMGSPATVIPEFVIEYGMDLIVMGTVGHRTIRELVEGNVSEQVMSQVGCNVLIVKPDDFVSPMALDDAELNSRQVA
jgi:universal stress protein E